MGRAHVDARGDPSVVGALAKLGVIAFGIVQRADLGADVVEHAVQVLPFKVCPVGVERAPVEQRVVEIKKHAFKHQFAFDRSGDGRLG